MWEGKDKEWGGKEEERKKKERLKKINKKGMKNKKIRQSRRMVNDKKKGGRGRVKQYRKIEDGQEVRCNVRIGEVQYMYCTPASKHSD